MHGNVVFDLISLPSIHRPVCGIELMHEETDYCFKDIECKRTLSGMSYYIFTSDEVIFWGSSTYDTFTDEGVQKNKCVNSHASLFTIHAEKLQEAESCVRRWEAEAEDSVCSDNESVDIFEND